jgi:hypothetical protein
LYFFKLLDEFKTKPQIELAKCQDKLGTIPDFNNVMRIKDGKWLIPVSRVVQMQLKKHSALDFHTFKRCIAASGPPLPSLDDTSLKGGAKKIED